MDISEFSNKELTDQLYKEIIYYDEDLYGLCHIIQKQIPRKMMYRLISKLYRLRVNN